MKPKPSTKTLPFRNPSRHRGFTLVEVMVVISIIAVLALVVVVMTKRIKQKAYEAKSLSPLNQASVACMAYAMENNGNINTVIFEGEERLNKKWIVTTFWGVLAPYISSNLTLNESKASQTALKQAISGILSTTDEKMKGTFQGEGVGAIPDTCAYVPYAFNSSVRDSKIYHKMSEYSDPSQTLYMCYGWSTFNKQNGEKYLPLAKTSAERKAGNKIDWFSNRAAAFVFLDGHVEILSPPIKERLFSVKPPKSATN